MFKKETFVDRVDVKDGGYCAVFCGPEVVGCGWNDSGESHVEMGVVNCYLWQSLRSGVR